jgi:hypothetical protein
VVRRETTKEMKRKSERKKQKEEKETLKKRQRVVGQGQRRRCKGIERERN